MDEARSVSGSDVEPIARTARFEVERSLGRGAHGEVLVARDRAQQGRRLALKRLETDSPAALARLQELHRNLDALRHEALVRLRGVERDPQGHIVLASDLVAGEDLRSVLERRGALPPRFALEIARQVLAALEPAHERFLPHGTLRAENVWLASRVPWSDENPFAVGVRITDHGLAAALGEREISAERDLRDVSRLLLELVTGLRAGAAAADPAELAAVRDPSLAALLRRAFSAEGFATAREFRRAVERSRAWRGPGASRRWTSAVATGVLLLVLAVILERVSLARRVAAAERELARRERELRSEESAVEASRERMELLDQVLVPLLRGFAAALAPGR
jgi:serine/threonine protein kinase